MFLSHSNSTLTSYFVGKFYWLFGRSLQLFGPLYMLCIQGVQLTVLVACIEAHLPASAPRVMPFCCCCCCCWHWRWWRRRHSRWCSIGGHDGADRVRVSNNGRQRQPSCRTCVKLLQFSTNQCTAVLSLVSDNLRSHLFYAVLNASVQER